jgi:hypothetical protein
MNCIVDFIIYTTFMLAIKNVNGITSYPSNLPTPILTQGNQSPGWFAAHYTAGHVACSIIGSITIAICCLLYIYNGRNKRAMERDTAAFFG